MPPRIEALHAHDVRFPTSDLLDGSDAIHVDPDYSCPYVTLVTDSDGLDDTWVIGYAGSLNVLDGTQDSDADHVSDADEFVHGTDPADPGR